MKAPDLSLGAFGLALLGEIQGYQLQKEAQCCSLKENSFNSVD